MSREFRLAIKQVLDLSVAFVAIVVAAPVMAILAVAILVDDGRPVLFRQERVGWMRRPLHLIKFRTMIAGADDLLDANGLPTAQRVTRVGRWLRLTSLDELPQLIHVLRREMSLVGPRPLLPSMVARLDVAQLVRFRMRPGVTGLAQVTGRNTILVSKRLAYDVHYVENWSLSLDFRILWRTFVNVLTTRNVAIDRMPNNDDLPRLPGDGRAR